ncbi:hypothetical protein K492DRAFT_203821 [Lichtheimia hyalospora FSU 10163]|nr:hypothetical protein K492DRAFT_203821 [Lichtheimia hyalospora FSU 10163]
MVGDESTQFGPPKSSSRLTSTSPLNQMVAMHNPIQLAAISNYKLAQLTFAPPDLDTMRRTALVKNMLDVLYQDTPPEWLDQMTRWTFFTPESLGDMTQERLEEIFAQYAQTIEAFQPLSLDDDDDDDDHFDETDTWVDEEELFDDDDDDDIEAISASYPAPPEQSIFSQPAANLSSELVASPPPPQPTPSPSPQQPISLPPSPPVSLVEKPLPKSPADDTTRRKSQQQRKSFTPSIRSNKHRLSWTSDTGLLPSSFAVHNMASEMMTLFDMDFSLDLKPNTAPKLPELPFISEKDLRRRSQRYSTDSLLGLIPKFEAFSIEEERTFPQLTAPKRRSRLSRQMTLPPSTETDSPKRLSNSPTVSNPPARSSSLKYRNQRNKKKHSSDDSSKSNSIKSKSSEFLASLAQALGGNNHNASHHHHHQHHHQQQQTPTIYEADEPKSKSMLRLASLMKGGGGGTSNRKRSSSSPSLHINDDMLNVSNTNHEEVHPRKSISSTISSSSSCWSSTSEILVARKTSFRRKPLFTADQQHNHPYHFYDDNDDTNAKRRSFTAMRPMVVEAQDLRRARSLGHHRYPGSGATARKKKHRSSLLMEKTMSKRKSIQQQQQNGDTHDGNLKRSKSAFVRIGRGFKSQRRRYPRTKEAIAVATAAAVATEDELRRQSAVVLLEDTTMEENTMEQDNTNKKTFVKRMATLGRRMRLQRA